MNIEAAKIIIHLVLYWIVISYMMVTVIYAIWFNKSKWVAERFYANKVKQSVLRIGFYTMILIISFII